MGVRVGLVKRCARGRFIGAVSVLGRGFTLGPAAIANAEAPSDLEGVQGDGGSCYRGGFARPRGVSPRGAMARCSIRYVGSSRPKVG